MTLVRLSHKYDYAGCKVPPGVYDSATSQDALQVKFTGNAL